MLVPAVTEQIFASDRIEDGQMAILVLERKTID
jgi:hypothetical protein